MWSPARGKYVGPLAAGGVAALDFSPDGTTILAGSGLGPDNARNNTLRLVKSSGESVTVTDDAYVRAVAWSPGGHVFAAGRDDQVLQLWRADTRSLLASRTDHGTEIRDLAFSPDGTLLATAGNDGRTWLWRVVASA